MFLYHWWYDLWFLTLWEISHYYHIWSSQRASLSPRCLCFADLPLGSLGSLITYHGTHRCGEDSDTTSCKAQIPSSLPFLHLMTCLTLWMFVRHCTFLYTLYASEPSTGACNVVSCEIDQWREGLMDTWIDGRVWKWMKEKPVTSAGADPSQQPPQGQA